jgi:hypothetical protein
MGMAATLTGDEGAAVTDDIGRSVSVVAEAGLEEDSGLVEALSPELLSDLDHPRLVLSDAYLGPDRRGAGLWAALRRATFSQRRSVLRLELVVVAVVTVAVASMLAVGSNGAARPAVGDTARAAAAPTVARGQTVRIRAASSGGHPAGAVASAPAATVPTPTTVPRAPATPPATPVVAPSVAPSTAASPAPAPPAPTAPAAALTPAQLGAEALTLVRYPWQRIPGYTIQFLPISAAPSSGFYGNTTFTWGHTGGTSVLYVYAGETVQTLAGITAFEIGHEVDASAVEPEGGEAQIENVLGIHPASWAPDCDCAEQGFLSGWYAAAFSNYWSPGVGSWSTLAPEPSGAVLTAIAPWLNPSIP